jgi:predicted benzoate:H+ symporter BenE
LFSFLFILSGIQILVIAIFGLILVGLTAWIAKIVANKANQENKVKAKGKS